MFRELCWRTWWENRAIRCTQGWYPSVHWVRLCIMEMIINGTASSKQEAYLGALCSPVGHLLPTYKNSPDIGSFWSNSDLLSFLALMFRTTFSCDVLRHLRNADTTDVSLSSASFSADVASSRPFGKLSVLVHAWWFCVYDWTPVSMNV